MRVLVAYASKNGSTAEIAEKIAGELRVDGLEVDCLEASRVRRLDAYGGVVLGSAVYAKRWRSSARRFIPRHAKTLSKLPWWVFSSGPVGEPKPGDDKATAWLEPPKTMAKAERFGVRAHVVFGGRVAAKPRNFVERAMAKNTPAEYADRRDWDQITSWADDIASQLKHSNGGPSSQE